MAEVKSGIQLLHKTKGRIVRRDIGIFNSIDTHMIELCPGIEGYQITLCPLNDDQHFAIAELTREEVQFLIKSLKILIGED